MKSRRELLAGAGAVSVAAVSGCLSGSTADRRISPTRTPDRGTWLSRNYGPSNNRYNPHSDRIERTESWTTEVRDTVFRVVVADRTVYVLTTPDGKPGGRLYALDASDGTKQWTVESLGAASVLKYADGRIYVGGTTFRALDPDTSEELFATTLSGRAFSIFECLGTIYVGTANGNAYGLNADTGAVRWKQSLSGSNVCFSTYAEQPLVSSLGHLASYATDRSWFRSIQDKAPERVRKWDTEQRAHSLHHPTIVDGTVYRGCHTYGNRSGRLLAHDLERKRTHWTRELNSYTLTPVVDPDSERAYTFAREVGPDVSSGTVYALDTATGDTIWSQPLDFRAGAPVLAGGRVYLAGPRGQSGRLVGLGASDGRVRFEQDLPGGTFSHPLAVADNRLYTGGDGSVRVFGP